MRTALIDVGGGMRAVYGAGIYDFLMDNDVYPFTFGIGVSAGAADLATYIARQRGRVLRFYEIYPNRKEYMGLWPLLKHGTFLNLKYIYEDLSNPSMEDPFDTAAFHASKEDMVFVTTDARTGEPVYFPKSTLKNGDLRILEASSALPVACKPIEIEGRLCYDGGMTDPIPYMKAFEMGADKVIVILTKPRNFHRTQGKDKLIADIISKKYPKAGKAMELRAETYNRQLDGMKRYEDEGRLLVIAPDGTCGVTTLRHRRDDILALYSKGYKDAEKIISFLAL